MLSVDQLHEFRERGYVVVPGAVPPELVRKAAQAIEALMEREPPDPEVVGPHFYFPEAVNEPALIAPLQHGPVWTAAEALTGPGTLEEPWQVQVALNIPPFPHVPGIPHIDGYPVLADGRPGTFTMLAGVLMSDQLEENGGNLWIWPGSHLIHAEYFRKHGPEAFFEAAGYPPVHLPKPVQLKGHAGDLLLAHYLLGHNIGGNTSSTTRRALYYRVKRHGHDPRWRNVLRDPWLEYDEVRNAE